MNRRLVSIACAAALFLAFTPKIALASRSETHHYLSKTSAAVVNLFVGGDTPDALVVASAPAILPPVILSRLSTDHDVCSRTQLEQVVLRDRAPPRQ
jgi:hypothetical protein